MTQAEQISRDMMEFIMSSPSCFHVVENLGQMYANAGFIELREENYWMLEQGKSYYVARNGSSIIAFRIPKETPSNYQIVAAHSDSPSFKIKDNPEIHSEGHYVNLNTEKYGGMLMAPWMDRPLSVAGRIVVKVEDCIETRLVNVDRDLVMIPNLAIHMNRKANDGYEYNPQKDMLPLYGLEKGTDFMSVIAKEADTRVEDILGSDLFLYNRMPYSVWGGDNEFISCTKLDDLQCVFAAANALIDSVNETGITMCAVFDNEEVGSGTKQGADSTMLSDVIDRISECLDMNRNETIAALSRSFMLSADNAHAVHPQYADKADPTNRPYINGGVVIKNNANQKYTTDAVSQAVFRSICKRAGVPVQSYVNRSDIAGGSTLGNISTSHISINTVDIGIAQLAMHSPYETAGVKDTEYMLTAMREFYDTIIGMDDNGNITLD